MKPLAPPSRLLAAAVAVALAGGLSACSWFTPAEPDTTRPATGVNPVAGRASYRLLQVGLHNGLATFEGREVVMYWDDDTVWFVGDQRLPKYSAPPVTQGQEFDFRGMEINREIHLRIVQLP